MPPASPRRKTIPTEVPSQPDGAVRSRSQPLQGLLLLLNPASDHTTYPLARRLPVGCRRRKTHIPCLARGLKDRRCSGTGRDDRADEGRGIYRGLEWSDRDRGWWRRGFGDDVGRL